MHSFTGPDIPMRAALFMDDAIQRHSAYAMEIEACLASSARSECLECPNDVNLANPPLAPGPLCAIGG